MANQYTNPCIFDLPEIERRMKELKQYRYRLWQYIDNPFVVLSEKERNSIIIERLAVKMEIARLNYLKYSRKEAA